jgi:dihydroxyacetone kinase
VTRIYDDPAHFTEDALAGFAALHSRYVIQVPGGVVRATGRPGKVAVIVGGGSGHYPAFCGIVGPGFADGAVVGNIFTSPSAADAASVARAADAGGGVLLITGNYAGDVLNFSLAAETLRAEGMDARFLVVTDDIASAPPGEAGRRRGIAGDFTVFKLASAAADHGHDLDSVERIARLANSRTRSLGVAFGGCTLPGAAGPMFSVPDGRMAVGLGIHGEPGISEEPMPAAAQLAARLVEGVRAERPDGASSRIAALLNGLGTTKYEELFVLWAHIARLLGDAGLEPVEPEVGELVTSLDMAGCSLTVTWLDEELEPLWCAPAALLTAKASSGTPMTRSGVSPGQRRPPGRPRRRVTRAERSMTAAPLPRYRPSRRWPPRWTGMVSFSGSSTPWPGMVTTAGAWYGERGRLSRLLRRRTGTAPMREASFWPLARRGRTRLAVRPASCGVPPFAPSAPGSPAAVP